MTIVALAMCYEMEDQPLEAVEAYESAIREDGVELEVFLNLALLYFTCTDNGYSAHHNLPPEFIDKAYSRAQDVLSRAEANFGPNSEIDFWKLYFPFIVLGEEPFYERCKAIAASGNSLVPYFYLFQHDPEEYENQARILLTSVRTGKTARERYIRSVLESAIKRFERTKSPNRN